MWTNGSLIFVLKKIIIHLDCSLLQQPLLQTCTKTSMFRGYSVKRVHIFEICAYFVKMCIFVYFEIEVIFSHTGSMHTPATLQANWGTVSSRSILKRFAFVWWTRLRHSSLGTGFRSYPQPRICTNMHISSKYAQNMHILKICTFREKSHLRGPRAPKWCA